MGKDFRIDITDLNKTRRAMQQVDRSLGKEVRGLNKKAADLVAAEAKRIVPVGQTQRLKKSTGARATQSSASVKSGTPSRAPYANPIHWGWKKRNIEPTQYLWKAVAKKKKRIMIEYNLGLKRLVVRAGLKRRM